MTLFNNLLKIRGFFMANQLEKTVDKIMPYEVIGSKSMVATFDV